MTLLQTRVPDEVAQAFETVATQQKKSPYALLAELVERTAKVESPEGWETLAARHKGQKPLPFSACEKAREGER